MKVLIDIGHPAHVHLFKHFAWEMQKKKHKVLFTCRDREFVTQLLIAYKFEYVNFGRHYKSVGGKIFGLIFNEIQMIITSLRYKPDVYVSHGSIIAAHSSFVMRKPHIALEDTFNMEQVRLSLPFSNVILTGNYPHTSLGRREISYPGYHELAYLHPNVFVPDPEVLKLLCIKDNEKFAIVRFVGWAASHDIGHKGISPENKTKLVTELSKYLKVFISSEGQLPPNLTKFQIMLKPEQMHNALYYADLFIGESATMASECAVMGTPAILFLHEKKYGVLNDQSHYGLLNMYLMEQNEIKQGINKALYYAQSNEYKKGQLLKKNAMLKDKIDVTKFLVWFVCNYPECVKIMQTEEFTWKAFQDKP